MWFYKEGDIIDKVSQRKMMERLADEAGKRFNHSIRKVLLFPHDITRCHSGTGKITNMLYHILGSDCHIDIIPTLGQHVQHCRDENQWMFGDIPERCFHIHDWQSSCTLLGEISNEFVKYVSDDKADWPIPFDQRRFFKGLDYYSPDPDLRFELELFEHKEKKILKI